MSQEPTSNLQDTLLITMPLRIYLETAWGFRERATVIREIGEVIIKIDPKETICHVEFNESTPDVATVWQIKAWREDYQRLTKLRQECEKERLVSALTRELVVKLVSVMSTHVLTMSMDDERRELMAKKLIDKKSWAGIRNLGVDCSELEEILK